MKDDKNLDLDLNPDLDFGAYDADESDGSELSFGAESDGADGGDDADLDFDLDEMKNLTIGGEVNKPAAKTKSRVRARGPATRERTEKDADSEYTDYLNALHKENKAEQERETASRERVRAGKNAAQNRDMVAARAGKPVDRHDYEPDYGREREPKGAAVPDALKYAFAGVVFVFILISALLAFQMNKLSREKKELAEKADAYDKLEKTYKDLLADYSILKDQTNDRYAVNEPGEKEPEPAANTQVGDPPASNGTENVNVDPPGQATVSAPPDITVTAAPDARPATYTVVDRDNLTKIAVRFYNDESKVKDIMEANNLKNDIIQPGWVLTLP